LRIAARIVAEWLPFEIKYENYQELQQSKILTRMIKSLVNETDGQWPYRMWQSGLAGEGVWTRLPMRLEISCDSNGMQKIKMDIGAAIHCYAERIWRAQASLNTYSTNNHFMRSWWNRNQAIYNAESLAAIILRAEATIYTKKLSKLHLGTVRANMTKDTAIKAASLWAANGLCNWQGWTYVIWVMK